MLKTTVHEEQQRDISASPERAWSLLSSAGAWSLRPGCFGFDVAGPGRLLFVMDSRVAAAGCEVWRPGEEQPGRLIRWQCMSTAAVRGQAVTLALSVYSRSGIPRPTRRGHSKSYLSGHAGHCARLKRRSLPGEGGGRPIDELAQQSPCPACVSTSAGGTKLCDKAFSTGKGERKPRRSVPDPRHRVLGMKDRLGRLAHRALVALAARCRPGYAGREAAGLIV